MRSPQAVGYMDANIYLNGIHVYFFTYLTDFIIFINLIISFYMIPIFKNLDKYYPTLNFSSKRK